ncbi:MAG: oligosaccharide flippase family protein [Solirubrobacteraceae bacterium]
MAQGAGAQASQGTIGRNSVRVLISQISGNTGYFFAVLLLARALGPTDRGTVAFITTTALVTSQLANLGITSATSVFAARSPSLRPALLANMTLVTLAGATTTGLCVVALLALVPGLRPDGIGAGALALLALGTLASAGVAAGYAFLQGCDRFRPYSYIQASVPWGYGVALAVVEVIAGLTVVDALAVWTAVEALAAVALLSAAASETGWTRPDIDLLRDSVRFGARAWIGSLSRLLNARTDQILIGILSTEAVLGVYAVSVNASEVLYYLPSAVATALLPAIAAAEPATRLERTLRVYRAILLLTLAMIVVAAALGPLLLPLVFGDAYRPAVVPFLLLLPSAVGFATMSVFTGSSLASLAPGRSSLGPLAALVCQTTLDFVLIPPAGASGAAIAASVALLVGGAVAVFLYRSRFPFAWGLLRPRLGDLNTIRSLARRLLRPPAVAPS